MGWVSTAIADEVSTAVTSAWIVPFARAIPSAQSRALVMLWLRLPGWRRRPRFRARPCRGTSASRRTAARPRRARGGSSVRVVGEGLLEEANLALKQRFAVRATYAGQGDPVIDVSVVAAESVDGSHRGHEPCKVARNARLEMDSRLGWPGYSPRLLAPTRPPNKCARPSTLMRTLTVYCACRGPFSPCRVTTTAAIHPPLARPVRGGSKVGRVPLARPNRCDGLLDRLLKLAAPACRVDGAVPDLAVRGDRSHEPVHARPPSCS